MTDQRRIFNNSVQNKQQAMHIDIMYFKTCAYKMLDVDEYILDKNTVWFLFWHNKYLYVTCLLT